MNNMKIEDFRQYVNGMTHLDATRIEGACASREQTPERTKVRAIATAIHAVLRNEYWREVEHLPTTIEEWETTISTARRWIREDLVRFHQECVEEAERHALRADQGVRALHAQQYSPWDWSPRLADQIRYEIQAERDAQQRASHHRSELKRLRDETGAI